MKDLSQKDIYPRSNPIPAKLVVYRTGRWIFAAPTGLVNQYQNLKFYQINSRFGIVNNNQTNPTVIVEEGSPGDYLVVNSLGAYSIVTQEMYKNYIPSNVGTEIKKPVNSNELKNPDYITKILRS